MTTVLRKKTKSNTIDLSNRINTQELYAVETETSVLLEQSVKNTIDLTYDQNGYADINFINLGRQYDHRVTWLRFHLENLLWQSSNTDYTYIIAATNISTGRSTIWEFDGKNFEVPRGITKEAGIYRLVLIIQEWQNPEAASNNHQGNVPDSAGIERFVTAEIKAKVEKSIYDPAKGLDISVDTSQKAALIKNSIPCIITDDGMFLPLQRELGQKYDSFVKYLKFPGQYRTSNLNDFNVVAIFKKGDQFFYSLCEKTDQHDELDDYTASYPMIAWIPPKVLETYGVWEVAMAAFIGDAQALAEEGDNGDYYFFITNAEKMKVVKNNLTSKDVNELPILSVTSNIVTKFGEIIITDDNDIFMVEDSEVK